MSIKSQKGAENNRVNVGGLTTLYGDKNIKIEKPYTIVAFPGGSVEISRTTDNRYWIHVAVDTGGHIADGRIDGTDCYDVSKQFADALEGAEVDHIAVLVSTK